MRTFAKSTADSATRLVLDGSNLGIDGGGTPVAFARIAMDGGGSPVPPSKRDGGGFPIL